MSPHNAIPSKCGLGMKEQYKCPLRLIHSLSASSERLVIKYFVYSSDEESANNENHKNKVKRVFFFIASVFYCLSLSMSKNVKDLFHTRLF